MIEHLSKILQPHKEIIGTVASVVTIAQFFSGALICKDIFNRRSTKGISAIPFVGGVVIGILVLKFAIMLQDKNMFNVNVAAIVLNSIYLVFYLMYSESSIKEVWIPAGKGLLLVVSLVYYISWEDPALVEYRYSLIVTILMLMLMGSPLLETREILKNRDASTIPLPLTFMGFIVSILWLLYGIVLLNYFMIVQNLLGTLLCSSQLYLCYKYPSKLYEKVD